MKPIAISISAVLFLSIIAALVISVAQTDAPTVNDSVTPPENSSSTDPVGNNDDESKSASSNDLYGEWTWRSSVDAQGNTVTPADPNQFVLKLTADGRLSSTTDCNSLAGSYIKDEEVLSVGPLAATKMGCMQETLEADYSSQLALVSSYTISGDTLTLILIKDAGTMTFSRR